MLGVCIFYICPSLINVNIYRCCEIRVFCEHGKINNHRCWEEPHRFEYKELNWVSCFRQLIIFCLNEYFQCPWYTWVYKEYFWEICWLDWRNNILLSINNVNKLILWRGDHYRKFIFHEWRWDCQGWVFGIIDNFIYHLDIFHKLFHKMRDQQEKVMGYFEKY